MGPTNSDRADDGKASGDASGSTEPNTRSSSANTATQAAANSVATTSRDIAQNSSSTADSNASGSQKDNAKDEKVSRTDGADDKGSASSKKSTGPTKRAGARGLSRKHGRNNVLARKAKGTTSKDMGKHAPVIPKGTKFLWADNTHISRAPVKMSKSDKEKKAELAKTKLKLIATDGKRYKYEYHGKVDLTDSKSISKLNSWRQQILYRRIHKRDDLNPHRQVWSEREKNFLLKNVVSKSRERKGALTGNDWQALSDAQNKKFKGKKLPAGEALAPGKTNSATLVLTSKTAMTIGERSAGSIRLMMYRWEDAKARVEKALTRVEGGNASDGNAEEADKEETEEEEDGESEDDVDSDSESDPNLEDSSDDEKGGKRPVGQPKGGVMVAAAA